MVVAVSAWWSIGWAIAVVVVIVAATLLLTVIGLGRRIVRQADEITLALDGTRENTAPLYEVKRTNLAISRITNGLAAAREAITK